MQETTKTAAKICFAKVKPSARIPKKELEDAGYDVYACFDEDYMLIPPRETALIPTGIASACSADYCFIIKERGSSGSKGLSHRSGVIDSGYRGEWVLVVTNLNDRPVAIAKKGADTSQIENCIIYPYEKAIMQAMLVPVPKAEVMELSYGELCAIESKRGTGAFGSSNK